MTVESDISAPGAHSHGTSALLPLLALGLAGAALGRALRATPLGHGPGSRRRAGLLLASVAGLALLRLRHRRVGEIERLLQSTPRAEEIPVTQSVVPVAPADAPMGSPGRNAEERLDEAVQETFPASDPISVRIE